MRRNVVGAGDQQRLIGRRVGSTTTEPEVTAGTSDAVAHHAELLQAQGMVTAQLGVPIGEALVLLRAHAYAHDRPLGDVARDAVAGRLRIDQS